MAKARAIVKRLKAVRNIRKITRTMELVATARFKKAMDRATEASAYTRKISEIVADLSATLANVAGASGITHPLLVPHATETNATLLVLTSNRGLCGGYNAGVLRVAQQRMRQVDRATTSLRLEVSGKRGINFCRFQKLTMDASYTKFEDKPTFDEVDQLANGYIAAYIAGKLDRLDVAYTRFESMSRQRAIVETLLPIGQLPGAEAAGKSQVEYEFLPSPQEILEEIVPAAFKARLFKCFLDAAVSEQISRMVAMKSATENAGEMISTLKASYNRARQSQITSELSEIIGGAAALE